MDKISQYCVGDAPELAPHIIGKFTSSPDSFPLVNKELTRFLWNSATFSYGVSIHDLKIEEFQEHKNFVYDKKTEMFFLSFTFGNHQLFMAHLGALHKMNFSTPDNDSKFYDILNGFDAYSKLSDYYITEGHGVVLSSVSKKIHLSSDFQMSQKEKMFFKDFERTYID